MRVDGQRHAPAALPPGKTRYPLYRRLGGPQGRSGQVQKISPPPGFYPRNVQPVVSRYTDILVDLWLVLRNYVEPRPGRPRIAAWRTSVMKILRFNSEVNHTEQYHFNNQHINIIYETTWLQISRRITVAKNKLNATECNEGKKLNMNFQYKIGTRFFFFSYGSFNEISTVRKIQRQTVWLFVNYRMDRMWKRGRGPITDIILEFTRWD